MLYKSGQKIGFSLLELVIVVIIIGVLIAVGMPRLQGVIAKSKLAEMYPVINAIEKAERMLFVQKGTYACHDDSGGSAGYCQISDPGWQFIDTAAERRSFAAATGLDLPEKTNFYYGVRGAGIAVGWTTAYRVEVYVADHPEWGKLLNYGFHPSEQGYGLLLVNSSHPWAKYTKDETPSELPIW